MSRELTYAEAIREATDHCLSTDPRVMLMGLGVPDPVGLFGTTQGLQSYGERVSDLPTAENGSAGIALGSTIAGMRPIVTHARTEFALLAVEQLVNQAAKWHYMFGGRMSAPLVFRMLVGRGWGQGPQHSQSFQAWFAHIPGLKVTMPVTPYDAKGMLISAVEDDDPVIVIEHRWLYNISGEVPAAPYRVPIGKARIARSGDDATVVATSYMVLEALRAADALADVGVSIEVIDLRSVRPWDAASVLASVERTGRLVVADTGWTTVGFGAEIVAHVVESGVPLAAAPRRVGLPDHPTPTSPALAAEYYPRASAVAGAVAATLGISPPDIETPEGQLLDVPDPSFTGPF